MLCDKQLLTYITKKTMTNVTKKSISFIIKKPISFLHSYKKKLPLHSIHETDFQKLFQVGHFIL